MKFLSLRTVYRVFPIIKHSKTLGPPPIPTPGPIDLKKYSVSSSHQGLSTCQISSTLVKAILQVLIYKALYDKSYLGSKTTMTSGEWTCLISFATAPLTCSERGGSEKFKMKIYVSSGIRTHALPVHDRKVAAP